MELGRCPACGTSYCASGVNTYGVLQPRSERAGGPYLLYGCESCGRRIRLIPHGQGRYARPGEPPPPVVPEEERRPPWMGRAQERPPPPRPPSQAESPPRAEPPPVETPAPEDSVATRLGSDLQAAMTLLGVGPEASRDEIAQAFRARSKTCHPDKVAHLDFEFQELAVRKFRQLREAYELLVS